MKEIIKSTIKKCAPDSIMKGYYYIKDVIPYLKYSRFRKRHKKKYTILLDDEMIDDILKSKKSLCRFGDGEFRWMLNIPHVSFENYSDKMADRLKEVLISNNDNILISIPRSINDSSYCLPKPRMFWETFWGKHIEKISNYLSTEKIYGDTEISRPYIDYADKSNCAHKFEIIKKLWDNRDIIIIEGQNTKLGVRNDLFQNVHSIRRILCPNANAFSKYDEILGKALALKEKKEILFLLALGPTATIMAYDLAKSGYQALDVGHIDIEYEWFLCNAIKKQIVVGKSMSEGCLENLSEYIETDSDYLNSIIANISL